VKTSPRPGEQAEALCERRPAGAHVWHSSLLHPDQLPWPVRQLARRIPFRQAVEHAKLQPRLCQYRRLCPEFRRIYSKYRQEQALLWMTDASNSLDARSAIALLQGGESAALAHLGSTSHAVFHSYKRTRVTVWWDWTTQANGRSG
jgi:deoxyribodipyrimidine photo-lyase